MIAVIDTNIVADDPFFFRKFNKTHIYLSLIVLEELDKIKTYEGLVGKNTRTFINQLNHFLDGVKDTTKGFNVDDNKFFIVDNKSKDLINDNKIIDSALDLKSKFRSKAVTLYTNDINMQVKARMKGLNSSKLEGTIETNVYDDAHVSIILGDAQIKALLSGVEVEIRNNADLTDNRYVLVNKSILAKYIKRNKSIKKIKSLDDGIFGLHPRNLEQIFALDALLDDNIKLVSLIGKAGSGKTLLAIAAALSKVLDEDKYDGVVIARPTISMGQDLGYLPGSMEEKLLPWVQPIFDNIQFLMGDKGKRGTVQELIDQKIIHLESLSHIRGRSFNKKFMLIDEAQNLDKHELKTIITRAGEGTKIVLTGDIYQIDSKFLDITNNGLTYVTEQFRDNALSTHINLIKSERSELAELATKLL
jgi:PhoH-like ATPase